MENNYITMVNFNNKIYSLQPDKKENTTNTHTPQTHTHTMIKIYRFWNWIKLDQMKYLATAAVATIATDVAAAVPLLIFVHFYSSWQQRWFLIRNLGKTKQNKRLNNWMYKLLLLLMQPPSTMMIPLQVQTTRAQFNLV